MWIKAKDRLPEKNEECICYCQSSPANTMVTSLMFVDGTFGSDSVDDQLNRYVTHWMPLPEPPK